MRPRNLILVAAAGAALAVPLSRITLAQGQSEPRRADADHGAAIAARGTAAGAVACAQCHAFNGISDASGAFPRIAGQSREYLAKQLRDFASGERSNAIMTPIAKALAADDLDDVAAYYAGVNGPFMPLKEPDPALVKAGEMLATVGSARRQVAACNNCHGPGGAGEPPAIPYLAAQYSNYIAFALREWQLGYRKSSQEQMAVVARQLNQEEIAAVAAYYQQARAIRRDIEVAAKEQK